MRRIFQLIVALFCTFFGPSFGEVISQVQVVDAWTYLTGAYYLSADGVLYSPGADTDASAYTYYRDEYHWIVAENVASFGVMAGGAISSAGTGNLSSGIRRKNRHWALQRRTVMFQPRRIFRKQPLAVIPFCT